VADATQTWLQRLATEISRESGRPIGPDQLYEEFKAFRNACPDPILMQSYPSDLHHLRRGRRPQSPTLDLILSFMDQPHYRELRVRLVTELAKSLAPDVRKLENAREVEKVLIKERRRRWRPGKRAVNTYWDINRQRVASKYRGLYGLLRVSSGNRLVAELFAIIPKRRDPTTVTTCWMCGDGPRVGDLIVNTYRFSGLTVCKSTDRIVEPITVSLLRSPHTTRRDGSRLLVLGGFAVGLKDKDEDALFHCRVAAVKLDAPPPETYEQFQEMAALERVRAVLRQLPLNDAAVERLRPEFLLANSLTIRALEAADVLGEVGGSFGRIVEETSV
jgi:hypothetical protein